MNELFTKRVIIVAAVFLLILAGGTAAYLKYSSQANPTPTETKQKVNYADLAPGNGTVVYSESGFTPSDMTIKAKAGFGCVVNLVNKSASPLGFVIAKQKNGPTWPEVEPGKNLLFDPRFPGLSKLTFQSQENSQQTFTVNFDASCR